MLQLDPPTFAHLPKLHSDKKPISSYRESGFTAEALLNATALMGWKAPHHEDPSLIFNESLNVFLEAEVMTLPEMMHTFNIDKIHREA